MSCGAPTIYKGEFMLADRRYCYPLTITDLPAATSSRARALHHPPSTTATSSSPPAAASACIERKSTSRPCLPANASASRRSTTAFGSSASCATISDTSIWSREPCNPRQPVRPEVVTHVLGTFCHPCVRAGPGTFGALGGIRTPDPQIRSLVLLADITTLHLPQSSKMAYI